MINFMIVAVVLLPVVAVIYGICVELCAPRDHEEDSLRKFTEDEIREMFGEFDSAKV